MDFPSIEFLRFDTRAMTALPDESTENVHRWLTSEEDLVLLNLCRVAPDVPASLDNLDALRAGYRSAVTAQGAALIEAEVVDADSCRAIWLIVRVNRKPRGTIYLASLTLPFRDFSLVLRAQCEEHGITGVREAVLLDELLTHSDGMEGWVADLYDPNLRTPPFRNISEDEKYDTRFPQHPLSRVRRLMRHLQSTLVVAAEVKAAAPFSPAG